MRSSVPLLLTTGWKVLAFSGFAPLLSTQAASFVAHSGVRTTSLSFASPSSRTSSTTAMKSTTEAAEVKVGDTLPMSLTLKEMPAGSDKPVDVVLSDLLQGKKVAIFGVPGAFTPGCSKSHLPSFITAQEELKAKGVEETFCLATNDAFVMEAWGRTSGGSDSGIRFISDADGELTQALGLTMDTPVMKRTKRFSLIADNGVVTHYFSSAEQASDTWAPNVLAAL